ncbi:MAG TPA: glycoside hydrolase family 2 TIM barrel-domain containing protein [Terriglobales bacterium]|nr:glycoside hydrolase family 2 TIM barrel-domain containing protein [Terriglobales bacterium]
MSNLLPYQASDAAQRLELEHGWEFLPDVSGRLLFSDLSSQADWRPARVGLSWNVQFEDLRDFMGAAWYRTNIDVPRFSDTRHVLLKFGAVDYFCEVFINGISVGTHEGGYTPFSFDIGRALSPGTNEVAVRVIDPPMNESENRALFPEMMYNEIPHGKQNWYVQNSGIWQGVRLEFCPSIYVERVDITPMSGGRFQADVRLSGIGMTADNGEAAANTKMTTAIFDASGRKVFEQTRQLNEEHVCRVEGVVHNPRLWEPDSPALYVMDVTLSGAVQYRRKVRFGFRQFEAREGKLYLNGRPFYMIAALDQDFYPETIHTPASEEFVRDMMLRAKRLGINVLRCHLKVAHPVYLDVADELGMLVWAEMPSWSDCWFPCDHFSMRAALRGQQMFAEVMARDWNHPCIVVRTIMNESWGINLQQEDQRKWLLTTFDRVKAQVAPLGRLVVDNSACEGNFHIKTDIEDFHQYYSMPDQSELWDRWLAEFASRPNWTFSPFGDAERTFKEPLIVSEFGNWGLPKLPLAEELPWWFHYSFGGREVTNPSGVFERFQEYRLDRVFRDYNDFAEESQWHQFISLKYEIETMRAHESIQGYVVTAMTDVHWEVNGLLDMWRNPKVFADELSRIQQPDLVFAIPERWSYFAGEPIRARVMLSHYSNRDLSGARLRWSTESGASGHLSLPANVEPGTLVDLGTIEFTSSDGIGPMIERVYLELRFRNGARAAENSIDVFVLPRQTSNGIRVRVHDPFGRAGDLERSLEQAGYGSGDGAGVVLVATAFDESVARHLAGGGEVVLLVDSEDALPPDSEMKAVARAGSELEGRWFSNFNWIRRENGVFRDLAVSRILGFESRGVIPRYVFQNIAPNEFDDVLSGATFGWIRKNSALAVQMLAGEGRVLATTFRFDQYGTDAYGTKLLDSMIRYVTSDECRPAMRLTSRMEAQR